MSQRGGKNLDGYGCISRQPKPWVVPERLLVAIETCMEEIKKRIEKTEMVFWWWPSHPLPSATYYNKIDRTGFHPSPKYILYFSRVTLLFLTLLIIKTFSGVTQCGWPTFMLLWKDKARCLCGLCTITTWAEWDTIANREENYWSALFYSLSPSLQRGKTRSWSD